MFSDVVLANTSDSLDRLRKVPMYHYEFKYDSVRGRKHMGVLPADAARIFPEAVDIVSKYTLPGSNGIVLQNFPVVDKNALFLHGLAAVQTLVKLYDEIAAEQHKLSTRTGQEQAAVTAALDKARLENDLKKKEFLFLLKTLDERMDRYERSVNEAWGEYDAEMRRLATAELELATLKNKAAALKIDEEKRLALKALEDETAVLELQQELARQRYKDEHELARQTAAAALQARQEEQARLRAEEQERDQAKQAAAQRVLEQRATLDKELVAKRAELELGKIRAEAEAKAAAERANEDVQVRKLELKARLDLVRQTDAIRQVATHAQRVVQDVISQPRRVAVLLAALLAFIAAYYAVRETVSVVREAVQAQLGKPLLVRETSIRGGGAGGALVDWLAALFFPETLARARGKVEAAFAGVVLAPQDREQIVQLAVATRNTKTSGAPYRHILLHGPPGTGKTLVARRLAECSGMDYAVMSGGDVGPLGADAVSQLHRLFRWAARSRKGLLLFIDEAEAFLGSRGTMGGGGGSGESQHLRNALNALLYQTGTQSRQFLLVLATNRPEDLDSAVLDRVDVTLRLGLPGKAERQQLVRLYMDLSVSRFAAQTQALHSGPLLTAPLRLARRLLLWLWAGGGSGGGSKACRVSPAVLADSFLDALAERSNGFSGREISKLFVALQLEMLLAHDGVLSEALALQAVGLKVREHRDKTGGADPSPSPSSSSSLPVKAKG